MKAVLQVAALAVFLLLLLYVMEPYWEEDARRMDELRQRERAERVCVVTLPNGKQQNWTKLTTDDGCKESERRALEEYATYR